MKQLEDYQSEMDEVTQKADESKSIGGSVFAWTMMVVGVVVTGTMTYSLTHEGMASSALWAQWVDIAAFLPVALLEGSAIALVYGRHHWFRSTAQRSLANVAGWAIWGILGATSVVHFAFGRADGPAKTAMGFYASYVLPLVIVAIPMLWKRLYDSAPESATRIAVLEAEADLKTELIKVKRQEDAMMVKAYRESLNTKTVRDATAALFERASIRHAETVAGFIVEDGEENPPPRRPTYLQPPSEKGNGRGN